MQHQQGYRKNIALGIIFISLITISWFLFFYSKEDFNKQILNSQNIDSIEVYNPKFNFTIVNKKKIQAISKELQNAKKINLDKTNINRGFTDLFFSLKNNKEERIRIYNNAYRGFIIVSHNTFYKNDSLIYLINEFANQINFSQAVSLLPAFVQKQDTNVQNFKIIHLQSDTHIALLL